MDQATRASAPSKIISVHRVRHIVVEAKQRQLSLATASPQDSKADSSAFFPVPFTSSLLVQVDLQEPRCCPEPSRAPSVVQGIAERGVARLLPESLSFSARITWCLSHTVLRSPLTAGHGCWDSWPFSCHYEHRGSPGPTEHPSVSR